jgi:hypothetical protein
MSLQADLSAQIIESSIIFDYVLIYIMTNHVEAKNVACNIINGKALREEGRS